MSISLMREILRGLRESFKFKIFVKGIDESNFHEHPDNPHVVEIIRQKAQIPKEISCKLCGNGYYEKDKADHIKEHHTDEYGNLKCPRCDLTFPTLTKVFLHIRYFRFSSFGGRDTKQGTFLDKNQHTQSKLLYFVNRPRAEMSKSDKI